MKSICLNSVSSSHLSHQLNTTQILRICSCGKIHEFSQDQAFLETGANEITSVSGDMPINLSQTFDLSSLPSSDYTIYLDFDGHVTKDTRWNFRYDGKDIVTPAYDIDGDPAFSDTEKQKIQAIWQRVSEDFAPFDVNVTTKLPENFDDFPRLSNDDSRWGVRVAIGGKSSDWYGGDYGGVAFLDSFGYQNIPVFVFSGVNKTGDEKFVAEAISHEVGHSLGLSHDGEAVNDNKYYTGHGSGETGWASIMGESYYQELSQWSRGEYNLANEVEDDLAIITGENGFGYRVDDAGDSIETAKLLKLAGSVLSGRGIIERNTDADFYVFQANAGQIDLNIRPASRGANLDILAELYGADGTLISSSNLENSLSANISTILPTTGKYYLKIDGVGSGDPKKLGYSDYGSLGQYFISGLVTPIIKDFVLDLVDLDQNSSATFSVTRQAAYENSVGFYNTIDKEGSIMFGNSILKPSDSGYTQAALQSAVANFEKFGLNLNTSNDVAAEVTLRLDRSFYMPIITSNQTLVNALGDESTQVYTAFTSANSDKVSHIRLVDHNTFGFEDMEGGGDRDFNDLVVKFATTT